MAHFSGKVIAVSGAASGIGLSTARILYQRGASLALSDIREDVLDQVIPDIEKLRVEDSQRITTLKVNVTDTDEVNQWISKAVQDFGRLDGAANVAGTVDFDQLIEGVTDASWERIMAINSTGTFKALRAELPQLQSGGSIVNVSSIAGLGGSPHMSPYGASKHAVIGLTRTAAVEYGPKGVRVNTVAPSAIETPLALGFCEDSEVKMTANRSCLKRTAGPDEVAKVIIFLLSDDASYITGSILNVDAGWTVPTTVDFRT